MKSQFGIKKRIAFFVGVGFLLVVFSLALRFFWAIAWDAYSSNWFPGKVDESKRRGDLVVQAIELYQNENDEYPQQLDDLVPKYIGTLPLPTAGACKWEYSRSTEPRGYWLRFTTKDRYPMCRLEENGEWFEDN